MHLVTQRGGRLERFGLEEDLVLGRAHCDPGLVGANDVAERHASILRASEGFEVIRLAPRNTVLVNARPVMRATLRDGDWVTIGRTTYRVCDDGETAPRADLEAIYRLSAVLSGRVRDDPIGKPLDWVRSALSRLFLCLRASILRLDAKGELELAAVTGMSKAEWEAIRQERFGERLARRALTSGSVLVVPDVTELGLEPRPRYRTKSCMLVPYPRVSREPDGALVLGPSLGVLSVADKSLEDAPFRSADGRALAVFAIGAGALLSP